jgi:hypothetical protein
MTEKQIERVNKKITDIKSVLAAEKRKFGCHDDSRGLRYIPPTYYIQLEDYTGGKKYFDWSEKNFPDDVGFPKFLFECAIILFKTGHLKKATKKAFQTFYTNPYWLDKYFGRPLTELDIWHFSNITKIEYTSQMKYDSKQPSLADFTAWLDAFISSKDFTERSQQFIEIHKKFKTETDIKIREHLVRQATQLEDID